MSQKAVENNPQKKLQKEKVLVQAVKNGDTLSFVELLGSYSRIISILALSFNLPRAELDDLCQEGRVALYKACTGYDDKSGAFSTYACACIKNAMTDFAKKYGKQKSNESTISIDDVVSGKDFTNQTDDEFSSLVLILNVLESDKTGLSKKERAVLLERASGASISDIAQSTGDSEKSVQNTLFRARKKLRQYLK